MTQDDQQLKLLSIFHYVVGGVSGLFACIPLIHLAIGLIFVLAPHNLKGNNGEPPPPFIGWLFIILASIFITIGWSFALAVILAGRFLARRTHYLYCLVMAGIECMFMPLGTVLGVFTILVLMRDSVKPLFGQPSTTT